jgi:hypothetical protein
MIMALSYGSFLICSERELVKYQFWYLIEVSKYLPASRYFAQHLYGACESTLVLIFHVRRFANQAPLHITKQAELYSESV